MRDLSIVIPAYNEEHRIGVALESIATYLADRDRDDEVIVVDDGSTDRTADVVRSHADRFARLDVVVGERNVGKGHAVRRGMLTATGRHRPPAPRSHSPAPTGIEIHESRWVSRPHSAYENRHAPACAQPYAWLQVLSVPRTTCRSSSRN